MTFVLRTVRKADLSRVAALHAASFPDDAWNSSSLATVLAMPGADGRICLADDGALCGMLLDQCLGPEAEILTLGVAPGWRRRGVASALIEAAKAEARRIGARRIRLKARISLASNVALFKHHGFAITAEETHAGFSAPTSYAMELAF